ncbi:MAG TPA: hypothetical protein VD971_05675 [Phycisphaerales bacterium]|nr:hypothetical protein [Phycisphaerales bacterium]
MPSIKRVVGRVVASAGVAVAGLGGGVAGPLGGAAAIAALAGVSAAPARAQMGMGMGADMAGSSRIRRSALEDYAKLLNLDAEQKETVKTLYDAYASAHQEATEQFRAKTEAVQEKVRDTQDFSLFQTEMPRLGVEFGEQVEKLEDGFYDDIKAILTPEQEERFIRVERHRRRENLLRFGMYSGAGVDLIRVASRSGVDLESGEFAQLAEQYEVEMDRRLVTYEAQAKAAAEDAKDPAKMMDMAKQMEMLKKVSEPGKDLRDFNRDMARRMSELMAPEARAKFEAEVNKRSYPRVYREPHVVKQVNAALEFNDLEPSQREQVAALKEQYVREAAPLNAAWADATRTAEDDAGGSIQLMIAGFSGQGQNEDVKKAREARSELDKRTAKRLEEILSASQRERLPAKKPDGGNPWMDFMPADDEDAEEGEESPVKVKVKVK